jgi:8-oxo-dGTP pyrophosphatase MutT (NUDIX family)
MRRPASVQPIPDNARKVFSGIIFDVYQWDQPQFDGSVRTFEKLTRPDTVVIVPITEDEQIIVTQQEQPGKQPFIGLAGGRLEKGEDAVMAAGRELKEETGYEAEQFDLLEAQQPIEKIDWVVYVLIGRNCRKVDEQTLDSGERITLKTVSFEEFLVLALDERFSEPELAEWALKAKYDPEKKEELRKLLFG